MSNKTSQVCEIFHKNVLPTLYGNATDGYRTAALIYGTLLNIYFIVGFILFAVMKRKHMRLQPRSKFITFCAMMSGILMVTVNIIIAEGIGRHIVPCRLRVIVFDGSVILIGPGIVATLLMYIYKLQMGRKRLNRVLSSFKLPRRNRLDSPHEGSERSIKISSLSDLNLGSDNGDPRRNSNNICLKIVNFLNVMKYSYDGKISYPKHVKNNSFDNEIRASNDNSVEEEGSANESQGEISNRSITRLFNIQANQYNTHSKSLQDRFVEKIGFPMALIILLGFHIPIIVALRIELDPIFQNGCVGCNLTFVDYLISIFSVGTYMCMLGLGVYAMRNEQDPLGIFSEIKMIMFATQFCMFAFIMLIIDPGNLVKNYLFSWQYLHAFGHAGVFFAMSYYQVYLAVCQNKTRKIKKHKVTNPSSAALTHFDSDHHHSKLALDNVLPIDLDLEKILNEPKARNALLEHTVEELSSENVVFLFKVKVWKQQWERETPEKVTRVAVNIYREFVARDSSTPINISNSTFSVTERLLKPFLEINREPQTLIAVINHKSIKPPQKLFDCCEQECTTLVETDTFLRFVKSDMFKTRIVQDGLLKKVIKR